jgi:DNA-directed RNA polymerase beta' subunit
MIASKVQEHYPIDRVEFGVLSKKDILAMAVCEITHNKITNVLENRNLNTVYDYRMGPLNSHDKCPTCEGTSVTCKGHFAFIKLNVEVVHPLFYKTVLLFLKCFCVDCSKLLITENHIDLWGIHKLKDERRFKYILNKIEKIKVCTSCNKTQPKIVFSNNEIMYYTIYAANKLDLNDDVKSVGLGESQSPELLQLPLTVQEIKLIFERVCDTDIVLLGFKPAQTRPINFILDVLPVLPPVSRPFIVSDNAICDDDLTIQYMEIIKANNHITRDILGNNTKQNKYIQTLNFRIKTLYDNSNGKAKHTNARQIKGIKERLCGKEGLIRMNLLGKRTNFSARTVIGPDASLRVDEIAIPPLIAETLTYPENVNQYNIDSLSEQILDGKINVVIRTDPKLGELKFTLKYMKNVRDFRLQYGDVAERQLRNNDIVLLNRQPSLHRGSMAAMRVKVRPGNTIRMNLAITGAFNADYDGDKHFVPNSGLLVKLLVILYQVKSVRQVFDITR